jgi:hypothetical protein
LANEKKELQSKVDSFGAVEQQVQQMQAQFQAMLKASQEREQKMLEALGGRAPAQQPQAEQPPEDPFERAKWEAVQEAKSAFQTELEGLRKAEQERQQKAQAYAEQVRRQQFHEQMMAQTQTALGTMFEGLDSEDVDHLTSLGADEHLLITANVLGDQPTEAAKRFREFLDAYADARDRKRAAKNTGPMGRSLSTPAPAATSRSVSGQEAFMAQRQNEPSMAELAKQGFSSKLAWRAAQARKARQPF